MCRDSHLCCDPVKTDFSPLIILTGSVFYFEILPLNKVSGVFMERCDVLRIKSNEGRQDWRKHFLMFPLLQRNKKL